MPHEPALIHRALPLATRLGCLAALWVEDQTSNFQRTTWNRIDLVLQWYFVAEATGKRRFRVRKGSKTPPFPTFSGRRTSVGPSNRPSTTVILVTRPQKVGDRLKDQPLVTGTLLEPTAEEVSAFHRLHRTQIAEINREAVRKIRAVNRDMITNDRGRSYNLRTRDDYTPEDLQQKFGLTYAEAQSCFLTID